ncbi:MAG: Acetoacetate metabolism regulatory protein AtoC [Pseudomonadota bacterium]
MSEQPKTLPKSPIPILVVDDDEVTRNLLQEILGRIETPTRLEITTAASGEEAIERIAQRTFPIILSDVRMLEQDGMAVLQAAKRTSPSTAVILMTGFGSMDGAIAAIREGAFDYVSKPFRIEQIESIVQRAARHWESLMTQAMRRAAKHFAGPRPSINTRELVGKSARIVDVYKTVARAALSPSPVLLIGEGGTGKSMVARAIHQNSQRRGEKFITWSGTGTSTVADLEAHAQEARGGTLYLEEVSQLSLPLQLELLKLLEDDRSLTRVIASTHSRPDDLLSSGRLREDLLYHLKVITIELPALRDRMDDLSELVETFLIRSSERNQKNISHLSEETLALFRKYAWPGNVRELEHAIEHAVVMANSEVLLPEDFAGILPQMTKLPSGNEGLREAHASIVREAHAEGPAPEPSLEELEKQHILRVLQEVNFNKSKAAEILGIDRVTLYRKAHRRGIKLAPQGRH